MPSFETRALTGTCWRLVEAQHLVATMKLTDTLDEQQILEELIEASKPPMPAECRSLDYLLSAPFRYRPYPHGSRFRRANQMEGVYYAAEAVETAVAEVAFYRLLFFAESPGTPWPENPAEYTAFSARFAADRGIDLTAAPYAGQAETWCHPTDYGPCQALADAARADGVTAIRYASVRDPGRGANLALLTCRAFASRRIVARQTWRIHPGPAGIRAIREFPTLRLGFARESFDDPRLAGMVWER
ncbi:RES family NAD+ phosphorylase [Methylobacterium sp. 17Sr1-1]|uniref:RES family NAD+ phosphorylase n=1 Tax=Methylobacterium sp. 17Sr1-1 TaxID=2202826 RepID=UPI001FE133C1|nr:RES family NAD+ phosphorylase [Methylobacterium sp. 17Sr1-1]